MSENIDTNINNYTLSEIMAIVNVNVLEPQEIRSKTDKYIKKFKNSDPPLAVFFMNIQSQLLKFADGLKPPPSMRDKYNNYNDSDKNNDDTEGFANMNETNDAVYVPGEEQVNYWYENQNLKQSDDVQNEKITERKQKIEVFGNPYVPMNRQQLGVNNTYDVPVAQDSLNPNLKNTITRFINLDSQFRQFSSGAETSATDYTLDLSDPLVNALTLRLYSYQIPYSWYVIDVANGNTCFWIVDGSNNVQITIESGNYTPSEFVSTLTTILNNKFTFPTAQPVLYNNNNGKLTFYLIGGVYTGIPSFTISTSTKIVFYDYTAQLQCETRCVNKSFYINQTLGWIMGFREPYINVDASGNTGTAILDLNGTKYLILVIDDYNQNHVNNGLVSITENSNVLKLPSYYSPDLPYVCLDSGTSNVNEIVNEEQNGDGLVLAEKANVEYNKTAILVPSAPRTLTQSQIYTINEINKNRNNNTNYRAKAPTTPDILAIIPIKVSGTSTGSLLVELTGSLQDNIRTYFGPVNIERMRVKLLDDKGNQLNLNGADWCVTLICDCLYQY